MPSFKPSIPKIILIAGLVAGTLDIIAACTSAYLRNSAVTPEIVLQFVASGVFGNEAFRGGSTMAAYGLLFHYIIAFAFVTVFVLLATRWKFLTQEFIISGILLGLLAWAVMKYIIVPLSHVNPPANPPTFDREVIAALILIFMIGLPTAAITRYYFRRE